jgi:hypothetical protein
MHEAYAPGRRVVFRREVVDHGLIRVRLSPSALCVSALVSQCVSSFSSATTCAGVTLSLGSRRRMA